MSSPGDKTASVALATLPFLGSLPSSTLQRKTFSFLHHASSRPTMEKVSAPWPNPTSNPKLPTSRTGSQPLDILVHLPGRLSVDPQGSHHRRQGTPPDPHADSQAGSRKMRSSPNQIRD